MEWNRKSAQQGKSMKGRYWRHLIGLGLVGWSVAANAVEGVSLEFGTGDKTKLVRLSGQWYWDRIWWQGQSSQLSGYWEGSIAQWRGNNYQGRQATQDITDIGITPVLRWQATTQRGWYGEAGIGAHYLTALYDNNGQQLSTHFQFGDHVGLGYVFNNRLDLGIRLQHFSNGSYKKPNDGVNFAVVRLAYRF